MFTYDAGYDFNHYERCDDGKWTRHLVEDVDTTQAPDDIVAACADVLANNYDGYDSCLYDGMTNGLRGAQNANSTIFALEALRHAALLAKSQDDAACCSLDFKTCEESCGTVRSECGACGGDDVASIWLASGPYEDPEDWGQLTTCLTKGDDTCDGSFECCPGLTCSSGTCVPESGLGARRLKEFVFERPDLPMDRNIVTLSDLL